MWNDGMCAKQIMDIMQFSRNTIYGYLYKATRFSMCDYSSKLNRKRTKKYEESKEIVK